MGKVLCFYPATGSWGPVPIVCADPEGLVKTEGIRAAEEVVRALGRLEE